MYAGDHDADVPSISPKPVLGSFDAECGLPPSNADDVRSTPSQPCRLLDVDQVFENGDRYTGQVEEGPSSLTGLKSGNGSYYFANGSTYEGQWERGVMHGHGVFTDATTGDRYEGQWEEGRRTTGSYYYGGKGLRQYHGAFGPDGLSKEGHAIIWENDIMYEAQYEDDVLLWQREFSTNTKPIQFVPKKENHRQRHPTSPLSHSVASKAAHTPTSVGGSVKGKPNRKPLDRTVDASSRPAVPKHFTNDDNITKVLLSTGDGRPLSNRQLNAALQLYQQKRAPPPSSIQGVKERHDRRKAVGGTLLLETEKSRLGLVPPKQLKDAMRYYRSANKPYE